MYSILLPNLTSHQKSGLFVFLYLLLFGNKTVLYQLFTKNPQYNERTPHTHLYTYLPKNTVASVCT